MENYTKLIIRKFPEDINIFYFLGQALVASTNL